MKFISKNWWWMLLVVAVIIFAFLYFRSIDMAKTNGKQQNAEVGPPVVNPPADTGGYPPPPSPAVTGSAGVDVTWYNPISWGIWLTQ